MSCKIEHKKLKGVESQLGLKLLDIYKDLDKATEAYDKIASKDFTDRFGDWTTENINSRTNDVNEPLLIESEGLNGAKDYYFLDKFDDRIDLVVREFSGFDSENLTNEIKEITEQISSHIFKKYIKENFNDITSINKFDVENEVSLYIKDKISESEALLTADIDFEDLETVNEHIDYLKLIEAHKSEFKTEIINFFANKKLLINEDLKEDDLQASQDEGLQGGDIQQSFERNTKDNATANVKLLMSFLPRYSFDVESDSFEKISGSALGEDLFTPMDVIHKELVNTLSDVITLENEGLVSDIYNQMIGVISELSITKPHYVDLLNILKDISEDKQTEFVTAFFNTKINFYTSVTEGKKEFATYKVFNSTTQNTNADKLINQWFIKFKNLNVDYKTKSFNVDRLKAIRAEIIKTKVNIAKNRKGIDFNTLSDNEFTEAFGESIVSLSKIFEDLGVNTLSPQGFSMFLNKYNSSELNTKVLMFNKLQGTTIRLSEMLNDILEKPKNIKLNPFKDYKSAIFKSLSESEAYFEEDALENTIRSGGKMFWTFGNPSYISNLINKFKKTPEILTSLTEKSINASSEWASHLLGQDVNELGDYKFDEKNRARFSKDRLENLQLGMLNSVEEKDDSINGKNNTSISYVDQIVDEFNKVLKGGIKNNSGKKIGESSIYSTSQAADKSTRHEITIDYFKDDTVESISGKNTIKFSKDIIRIFTNYFSDEINRMRDAFVEVNSIEAKDYKVFYHTDKNGNLRTEDGLLKGNAFQSQLFPEMSAYVEVDGKLTLSDFVNSDINQKLLLYDTATGEPLFTDKKGFNADQKVIIGNLINKYLNERVNKNFGSLVKTGLLKPKLNEQNKFNGYSFLGLDTRIVNTYKSEDTTYMNGNQAVNLVSDYTLNSIIANVEYTKLFTGDPAYYKNMVDFFKRVPATYTDGINLRLGLEEGDSTFNLAVIQNQEVESKYLDLLSKSLDLTNITKADKAYVMKAYTSNNQTDAQGWITPERWMFLTKRLGKWNSHYESVYSKMMGTNKDAITADEMKYVAQPLKGVYFGIVNGVPTYLKYSQAVLFPTLVKGSQLENLYTSMQNSNVQEAVTLDGVKVGANTPNVITDNNGDILKNVSLNKLPLSNADWKLQQDLPTKLLKDTLLGSQIQKNIYSSVDVSDLDATYTLNDGTSYSSQQILDELNDVMSSLSNKGINQLSLNLEKDEYGRINVEKFYALLEEDGLDKDLPLNILKAIQKNLPIDAIPGVKDKMYNTLFAMIKKAAVKIKTNGGSFIQMSNFGLDKATADAKGVKWLVDASELKPPLIVTDLDGKKTVTPGQIFISHSEIAKLIPNYEKLSISEINEKIDSRLLRAIGYRIPNQGQSSNDPLQIVGILPSSMGDTIVGYTEIPTKTGSDFDIDKMYVMLPSSKFEKGKLNYTEFTGETDLNKEQLNNKLFEIYWSILTNVNTYADLITPIDYPHIMKGIKRLHGDNSKQTGELLKFYDPLYQLELKRKYIGGKSGVGSTANMLVDHARSKNIGMKFNGYYIGVGHSTDNGASTILDLEYSESLNGTKYKIAHTISAFLNAFVDNAKDPYIDDGNYNNYTSGPTFLLIRAGVHPDWINAFIGNPVLKELASFTETYESIAIPKEKEWMSSYDVIFKKYQDIILAMEGNAPTKKSLSTKTFNLSELELMINESDNVDSNRAYEYLQILEQFKTLQDKSKKLSESVALSRFDTEGAGKDYLDSLIYNNRIKELLYKEDKYGELNGHVKKYIHNNKITSLGTQVLNTLQYSEDLLQNNPNLFLMASKNITDIYNIISSKLLNPYGGSKELVKDRKLIELFNKELYSYIMSDFEAFKIDSNPVDFIKDTIDQILEYKQEETDYELDIDEKNLFINSLKFYDGSFGIFSKNMSKETKDSMYRSFRDLYDNNPDLADNIIKSLYFQNGFNRNLIDFREFIPHEWFIANNIRGFVKNKTNELSNYNFSINTFFDQLIQSNMDNKLLVPTASSRVTSPLSINGKNIDANYGFVINTFDENTAYKKYSLGENNYGGENMVEYLKTNDTNLYKLEGYLGNQAVYIRSNTLGLTDNVNHLKVREYSYNQESVSTFKANTQINTTEIKNILNKLEDFTHSTQVYSKEDIQIKYTKDLSNILSVKKEDVSLQEDLNVDSKGQISLFDKEDPFTQEPNDNEKDNC